MIAIISNPITNLEMNNPEKSQVLDDKIIEGVPVFMPAAAGNDYVDSVQSLTYGAHSVLNPGMGVDSTTTTDLTEAAYSTWTNLLTQSTFTGLPSGWSHDDIFYSDNDFNSVADSYGGYLSCTDIDTSSASEVRFRLNIGVTSMPLMIWSVGVRFYSNTGTWDYMGQIPDRTRSDVTFSSTDSKYQHSSFKVQVEYTSETFSGAFEADNWRVDGLIDGHRFQAVYKFTGVDYGTYNYELLHCFFKLGSSPEYLDFRFEAGDTTPDAYLLENMNDDFSVSIHPYLLGSEFYVDIRDDARLGDSEQDTWQIERLFIQLSNAEPVNDLEPVCTNLDDGDNLYANYKLYEFSCSATDADGYSHIDYLELRSYDYGTTSLRWTVRFDEDTNTFTEQSGSSYIHLDTSGSSYTKFGSNLDVTFKLYIEWAHPNSENDDLYQYVRDADIAIDSDSYDSNYDYESRLDLSTYSLNDGSGTSDRGSIDGTIIASGTVNYYGSSLHPPSDSVDVWVSAPLHSGAIPWSDTTLSSGAFSMNVYADDVVGSDIYTFKVVEEGDSSGDPDLLESSKTDTYISDEIYCLALISPSKIVDSASTGYMNVYLLYAYDDSSVIDGTYQLEDRSLTHQGGFSWQASYAPNATTYVTYDSITIGSANTHGITGIDMDSQSLTMYWEQLVCYIDGPDLATINIGENATGIHVWAEYTYWNLHGYQDYDGTLNINNTIFVYSTIGTRGYNVTSANGDDVWSVSTITSSQSTSCTWVYPEPPPTWNTDPENQFTEFGTSFSYALDAVVPSGVSQYWINDTTHFTISQTGVIENATILELTTYGIQVWVNDTYGRELTGLFSITVRDTTGPTLQGIPLTLTIEFGTTLEIQLSAWDLSGIGTWWLTDSISFSIDEDGTITALHTLAVGIYNIEVYVSDIFDNNATAGFSVNVTDTTSPVWIVVPQNVELPYGETVGIQLSASDLSGISEWTITSSSDFTINGTGYITHDGALDSDTYELTVTAIDPYGNSLSAVFAVTVVEASGTPVDPITMTIIVIIGGVAIVIVVIILHKR